MTDQAWSCGMAQLLALGLGGWPTDPGEATARAREMRRALDDLSDDAWIYACDEAAKHQSWFPVPATLRSYAADWMDANRPTYPLLPETGNGWMGEDRQAVARRGIEMIRQALIAAGNDPGEPAKAFPSVHPSKSEVAAKVRMLEGQAESMEGK